MAILPRIALSFSLQYCTELRSRLLERIVTPIVVNVTLRKPWLSKNPNVAERVIFSRKLQIKTLIKSKKIIRPITPSRFSNELKFTKFHRNATGEKHLANT